MHVVVDSNIYYQDRNFSSPYFAQLRELGRLELLTIHIPWMVYRECTTKAVTEIQTDLELAIKALGAAAHKGLDSPDSSQLRSIADLIRELMPKVEPSNSTVWWSFIVESKARLHEFNDHHAREVLVGYFDGDSPFKTAKSRNDIPDAFIFQMVSELAANRKIYFLSGDKNLSGALAQVENVMVVASFDQFFDKPDVKQLVERSKQVIIESQAFRTYIIGQQSSFENAYNEYIRKNRHITMTDQMIHSDYHEAEITELYQEEVRVLTDQIRFIDQKWYVPMVVVADAVIRYLLWKDDYYQLDEDRRPQILRQDTTHYFLVEETKEIRMEKNVVINPMIQDVHAKLEVSIDYFDDIKFL